MMDVPVKTFQVTVTNCHNCIYLDTDYGHECGRGDDSSRLLFDENKDGITDTCPAWIESQKADTP